MSLYSILFFVFHSVLLFLVLATLKRLKRAFISEAHRFFSFFFFPDHSASDSHTLYILILNFSASLATQLFFPLISSLGFFYRKRAALGAGLRVAAVMALCFIG